MALSLGRKNARSTPGTAYGLLAVIPLILLTIGFILSAPKAYAQEDELNKVHVPPPPPKPDPNAAPLPLEGEAAMTARRLRDIDGISPPLTCPQERVRITRRPNGFSRPEKIAPRT